MHGHGRPHPQGWRYDVVSVRRAHRGCRWLRRVQVARFAEHVLISPYEPGQGNLAEEYMLLMFKGMNVLSNLSFDPMRPANPAEMIFSVVAMFCQIAIEAYILGGHALRIVVPIASAAILLPLTSAAVYYSQQLI